MSPRLLLPVLLAPLLFAAPEAARAQDGFLFGLPTATVSLRFGHARPAVGGELFDMMRRRLTVESGDFAAEAVSADALFVARDWLDLGVGVGYSQSTVQSEDRDYLYQDDSPIEQTTRLRRVPVTVLARLYPLSRGESVSRHAWIPARFAPFVGGGAGFLWYKLEQYGDFVDEQTLDIFEGRYESSGSGFAAHALGGVDYWVTPRVALTGEGRYTWSSAMPESTFQFDRVDLSGWQVTAGVAFRF